MRTLLHQLWVGVLAISFVAMASMVQVGHVAASPACDLYASTTGDDTNTGTTPDDALRNIRVLVPRLRPGETGCLVGPTFSQGWDGFGSSVAGGGTREAPVTITSAGPSPTAFSGPLVLDAAVHDVIVRDLKFVGAPAPAGKDHGWTMLQLNGERLQILDNDITDPKGVCIGVGTVNTDVENDPNAKRARAIVIDGNRIHGCGKDVVNWAAGESGVHAVYVVNAAGTRITNNYIYDAVNRGIQLYPNAIATRVSYNVLDGNGANVNMGSWWSTGYFSRDARFRYNIISNSVLRSTDDPPPNFPRGGTVQINGFYPADSSPTDYGNLVAKNCIYQEDASKNFGGYGYVRSENVFQDPLYIDRANNDFTLEENSPCRAYGPQGGIGAYRPDASIRRVGTPSASLGDDVWNKDAISQTWRARIDKGEVKSFRIIIQNDGGVRDSFSVVGDGSSNGFTLRYFRGRLDVTPDVKAGRYSTGRLAVGESHAIRLRVKVSDAAETGSTGTFRVHAVSFKGQQAGLDVEDVVAARIRVP